MTAFGSLGFFLLLAALALPTLVLGLLGRPLRLYGAVASTVGVLVLLSHSHRQLVLFVAFVVGQVLLMRGHLWFVSHHGRRHVWERRGAALLALLPLVLVKATGVFDAHLFGFLGVSYLTFRAVQVILEISDGLITNFPLWEYAYFLTFFPSVSSGPIDRSRRFVQDLAHRLTPGEYARLAGEGLRYLVLGATYKFVAAAFLAQWAAGTERTVTGHLAYMYLYGLQLFFDFAGYSWMAVGAAYLFGVRTPVNFRLPFIAESIKDFWNRWHITLSFWFRDYLYSRLVMAFIKRKVFTNRQVAGRVAMIVNMGAMGLWHGTRLHFILYGLFHGLLLVGNDVYERGAFHKRHRRHLWYRIMMIVLTFHLVMLGFFIFSGRLVTI
jgi:membrane protein involved in D-alanine export